MNAKVIAIVAIVVALAATGAGWKWAAKAHGHASGSFRIAGWTWASMEDESSDDPGVSASDGASNVPASDSNSDSQQDTQ